MGLSRKRRRELRRLRGDAQDLLGEQRIVLGHAGDVLQQAGRQAKQLNTEHLAPRVGRAVDRARPTVDRVCNATTPLVAGALAGTIRSLDRLENAEAARQLRRFGENRGLIEKKKRKTGGIIALGLGVAAAAAVGYTLWQAFRTDDELWVAPEDVN